VRHDRQEAPQQTGRLGYREPHEPRDERPCIDHAPFWRDESERLEYEHAVESWPRKPGEGALSYIARLAGIVEGRLAPAGKTMPHALGRAAHERRLNELEAQRLAMRVTGETER